MIKKIASSIVVLGLLISVTPVWGDLDSAYRDPAWVNYDQPSKIIADAPRQVHIHVVRARAYIDEMPHLNNQIERRLRQLLERKTNARGPIEPGLIQFKVPHIRPKRILGASYRGHNPQAYMRELVRLVEESEILAGEMNRINWNVKLFHEELQLYYLPLRNFVLDRSSFSEAMSAVESANIAIQDRWNVLLTKEQEVEQTINRYWQAKKSNRSTFLY
jgi:hypothetical protein